MPPFPHDLEAVAWKASALLKPLPLVLAPSLTRLTEVFEVPSGPKRLHLHYCYSIPCVAVVVTAVAATRNRMQRKEIKE